MSAVSCPSCGASFAVTRVSAKIFCPNCGKALIVDDDSGAAVVDQARQAPVDARIGTTVAGRYRLIRQLGAGGMGAVYVAEQLHVGREVALKVIRRGLSDEPHVVERFVAEARAVAKLNHPHIVTLHDFGDDGAGGLFIAMELIPGESLRQRLHRTGAQPWREAARIAIELCDALAAVHAVPIIHRDLKPENVMLADVRGRAQSQGHVKLLDFGIAKLASERDAATAASVIVGTPGYMAPEVHDGIKDARGDLYALGVILFELLTGKEPFSASGALALVMKHVNEPAPRASTVTAHEIPRALDELVLELMAKTPRERPADADAVRRRLERIVSGAPAPAATSATPPEVLTESVEIARVVAGKYRLLEMMPSLHDNKGSDDEVKLHTYHCHRAQQIGLERQVALKLFERKGPMVNVDLTRALDDIRAIARLEHPNVAAVLDCGFDDDGSLYVAHELLTGESLVARMKHGPVPLATALRIALDVARALAAAHDEGLVHPGLQPSGIFLVRRSGDEVPVILDFGVAEPVRLQLAKLKVAALRTSVVTTGIPGYSAPERHRGITDRRGDLYSLGVILYEMIAGRPLFDAPTPLALVTSHTLDPAPPLPSSPAPLQAVLASLLAKSPEERPADANAVVDALRAVARQVTKSA